jgi:hypothetical protein
VAACLEIQVRIVHSCISAIKIKTKYYYISAQSPRSKLQTITGATLVHTRIPPKFTYHAIIYVIEVLYVIHVKKLSNKAGQHVAYDKVPRNNQVRFCGCLHVTKRYTNTRPRGNITNNRKIQKGVICICSGYSPTQQGGLIGLPPAIQKEGSIQQLS